jgi:hypothetical protein
MSYTTNRIRYAESIYHLRSEMRQKTADLAAVIAKLEALPEVLMENNSPELDLWIETAEKLVDDLRQNYIPLDSNEASNIDVHSRYQRSPKDISLTDLFDYVNLRSKSILSPLRRQLDKPSMVKI